MYTKIIDPHTKKKYSINSLEGKYLIKNYLSSIKVLNKQKGGSELPLNKTTSMNLVYMAKPVYGGWVSFTAHLSQKYGADLYKIGNKTESKKRPYGYNTLYQNININELVKLPNLLITAIDKNYYKYLDNFPDNTIIVIHDPTEVKGKSCQPVIDNLSRFRVVTIRKTVQKFLKEKYNIDSEFLVHPFFEYPKINIKNKSGAVSTSRIDYDKHTDIILETNELLKSKKINPIKIYGAKNDLYVYRKLREMNLDTMDEKDPKSAYKGRFDKSFEAINKILSNAKYMVDLSAIKNDGGGSQYTFLEAIYENCALILSSKWTEGNDSMYQDGLNSHVVSSSEELAKILEDDVNTDSVVSNAYRLLDPHIDVDWTKLFK